MNPLMAGSSMRVNTDGIGLPHSVLPNEMMPTCKQPFKTAPPERKLGRGKLIKKNFSPCFERGIRRFLFNSRMNLRNFRDPVFLLFWMRYFALNEKVHNMHKSNRFCTWVTCKQNKKMVKKFRWTQKWICDQECEKFSHPCLPLHESTLFSTVAQSILVQTKAASSDDSKGNEKIGLFP